MNRDFFPNGLVSPPLVLGLKLREFSLGHWLLLYELDSPVLYQREDNPLRPVDFMLAVLVCSLKYEQAKEMLERRLLTLFLRFWAWRCRKMDGAEEWDRFKRYMTQGTTGPKILQKFGGDPYTSKAPAICNTIGFMASEMRQPLPVVMETPVRMAFWLHAAWLDMHCKLDLWDERRETLWKMAHDPGTFAKRN